MTQNIKTSRDWQATKIRGNCSIIDFSFALVNWTLPANYDPDQFPPQVWQFNFPSYHLMIRFWFKEIFEHPALLETKFYMRLDTDSLLLSPILVDPFQIMQRENLAYGWRVMDAESPFVSVGLSDFMAKYLGKNPESKKVALKNHFSLPSSKSGIPMMYNNFELVNMQRFRAMDMKEFIERVDASNGIFVHRWGDAPLRYFQCKMILDFDREVFSFLDFDYYHGNHKMFFKRGQWRTWYLFILTFLPWFFR